MEREQISHDIAKLRDLFERYAEFGNRRPKDSYASSEILCLDSTRCVKLATDCGILDKSLSRNDVDLTFHFVKSKGQRKISFKEFMHCIDLWAKRKCISEVEMMRTILRKAPTNPTFNSITQPEFSKFHDDFSTYTGVYKRGGPTVISEAANRGLKNLLDRSPADIRGRKIRAKLEQTILTNLKKRGLVGEDYTLETSRIPMKEEATTTVVPELTNHEILHPDWIEIKNPNAVGKHDQFYYMNRHTKETSWQKPTVSAQPPPPPPELLASRSKPYSP